MEVRREGARVSLLAALLASDDAALPAQLPDGSRVERLAPAVWSITPADAADARAVSLSAGIHGDETAPVEMLARLLDRLVAGEIAPHVPLFVVFGNLAALRAGTRFIDVDLNRLFAGAAPAAIETGRAKALSEAFTRFARLNPAPLHLDLHSAIRASHYERFAIFPNAGESAPDDAQRALLAACGVQAVLAGPHTASTFSAFSTRSFGGESYTMELGRVRQIGAGAADEFAATAATLEALVTASALPAPVAEPSVFRIAREIVKQSEAFRLNLPEDAPNFSPLAAGALIAEDGPTRWYAEAGEHIVFPNPAVRVGLRAGLLVRPA
jgi:succinylglutamate desuccinylase